MTQQPDSASSVLAQASPGLAFTVANWVLDIPVEKWVSVATLIFVVLQIIFLLRDRLKKRKARRAKIEIPQ